MDYFLEIFKLLIPAGIVGATVYFVLKSYMENQEKLKRIEVNRLRKKEFTVPQMQAYERLILFLERNSPDMLAMKMRKSHKSADSLQHAMVQRVKDEFDHNITQQLYVSGEAWKIVVQAKEESIRLINISASKCKEDEPTSDDLTKMILSICSQLDHLPSKIAVEGLKNEFRSRYG